MTSRLFHTVVSVGIALGAASAGCQNPTTDEGTSANAALTANGDPTHQVAPTDDPDAGAFCDATWPTTKGGIRRHPAPACIDPNHECTKAGPPGECAPLSADGNVCTYDELDTYTVCVDGAWTCKPGRRLVADCSCWQGEPCTSPDAGAAAH
jgi:hypothetical protein